MAEEIIEALSHSQLPVWTHFLKQLHSANVLCRLPALSANQRRWRLVAGLLPALSGADIARSPTLETRREVGGGGGRQCYIFLPLLHSQYYHFYYYYLLYYLSTVLTHRNSDNLTLWKS